MTIHTPNPSAANILWFLPTHGDGRYLGTSIGGRATDLGYLRQIATSADRLRDLVDALTGSRKCFLHPHEKFFSAR